MYAIAFDMLIDELKENYGTNYHAAYKEIEEILEAYDFYRRQGSVYVTDNNDLANLVDAITALKDDLSWFGPSVRDLRAFKIESWSNFTPFVKGTSNRRSRRK
jgi:virulence-associated protein VapD